MTEQTVNARSLYQETGFLIKKLRILAVTCLAFVLSACIPVGDNHINTKLFKDKDDMYARAGKLEPGMSKKAVFETVSIDPEKFSRMSMQEVQQSIYGNSMVQGTPEQLEQFRQRLARYEGYSLPYREIKSNGSLGFGVMKVNKNGYDLKLVLIFEKGRLLRASVDGNQDVNEENDQSLINVILRKATGFGF